MLGNDTSQGDPALPGSTKLTQGQSVGRGRYLLRRKIGHGGMGIVWEAEDTRLGETVALKFLPDQIAFDVEAFENLRRETLKSRQLTHANILRIHDLIEEDNEPPFLAMEYVDGDNLAKLRAQRPKQLFSWETLKPLVVQLCDALEYAHSQKLIHRDLKPANILIDGAGRLKLADLGLTAVAADSIGRLTHHTTSGTPRYMSPQHLSGLKPRVSDDIYSLGATLYELLTSKPPFHSGDISYQVINIEPAPLEDRLKEEGLTNEIPKSVSDTVLACLSKAPERRPASAREVKERLLGLAAGASQSTGTATKQFWLKAAAVLALVVLLGGLAMLTQRATQVTSKQPAPTRSEPGPAADPTNLAFAAPASAPERFASLTPAVNETSFKPELRADDFPGWTMDPPGSWAMQNGVVTGTASDAKHIFLQRRRSFGDFELRFSWKSSGDRGAMLVFRCPLEGDDIKRRYRTVLSGPEAGTMLIADAGRNLPETRLGQITDISDGKWRQTGSIGQSEEQLRALVRANDWNDLTLIARSNRFVQFINGVRVLEMTDNLPTAVLSGPFYFRVAEDGGGPATLQLRNVRVLELSPTDAGGDLSATAKTKRLPPVPSRNPDGFRTIFNGRTLADWTPSHPGSWWVTNGVLATQCTGTNQTTLITWREEPADFELRFSLRTTGRASVRYRENHLPGASADFYSMLINEQYPGATALPKGERLSIIGPAAYFSQDNGKYVKAGTFKMQMEDVHALYKTEEWNDWVIIARGNRFVHYLNGKLIQDFTDKDITPALSRGRLSFRLSTQLGPSESELQIKNIRLKTLPPAATL